ncbi:hypothetical protein C8T65DRAFT_739268 [Cerioporus squamosus]|nr:hypothetical protein C8T65DRAFT_739268 [Cerioporus squamosus]
MANFARPLSSLKFPPDPEEKVDARTLARAARICKAFTDPALSILWHSLTNIVPLLNVLPTFSEWRETLTGRVTSKHWQRFREYGSRIRELWYHTSDDNLISKPPAIVHHMQQERGSVLPRLRMLSYEVSDAHRTSLLPLLSPGLESLELSCTFEKQNPAPSDAEQGAVVDRLLRAVCTTCPSLRELQLCYLRSSLPLQGAATGLQALKTLQLTHSHQIDDLEAIRALAALPQLEKLHDLRLKLPHRRTAASIPLSGFRSLKDLFIVGDADDVLQFLQYVLSALDTVQIILWSSVSAWLRASRSISPLLLKSVRELIIQFVPSQTRASGEPIRDISEIELVELLRPLLLIRTVETFCLVLRKVGLVSDDSLYETMAKSWPQLRNLWLDVDPSLSTPTFRTLSAFASHCPLLNTLVLPHLDHTALASDLDLPYPINTSLRRLSFYLVDKLRIDDVGSAARHLVDLFPKLDMSEGGGVGGGGQTELQEEQWRAGAVLWGHD